MAPLPRYQARSAPAQHRAGGVESSIKHTVDAAALLIMRRQNEENRFAKWQTDSNTSQDDHKRSDGN